MSDDVIAEAGQEITKGWRAGMQVAEFMARRRQRDLARAERQSVEDERRLRQVMEAERRLAAPVYRAALDEGWWETATVEQAARVYSVAGRFSQLDLQAERAVAECERQAKLRWNIDLAQAHPVLTSQEVDPRVLAAAAPAIAGEEREDWGQRLDQSASQTGPVQAEQATAVAWVKEHYSDRDAHWVASLDEDASSRQWAHRLYSCLAAEGYDLDAPPALLSLNEQVGADLEARATEGYQAALATATGADRSQIDIGSVIGADSAAALKRAWQVEHDGAYPDPQQWYEHFASQGSRVLQAVPDAVRVADSPARSGTYTELARHAAAPEAERAGMTSDAYLDSLQLHQRRALITGHGLSGSISRGRASAYRIAYAQETHRLEGQQRAAEAQQDLATSDEQRNLPAGEETEAQKPQRQAAREDEQDVTGQRPGTRSVGGDQARRQATAARARTDKEAAEAREALYASGGTPTATTSREQGDVFWVQADETVWDSQAAREEWAQQQLEAGAPPEAVRAAVTGQQALHEPASRATRAPSKPRQRGRSQGVRQSGARRRQRHR